MSSEDELIRRTQCGDAEAFCVLAETYERRIYSLALHYCHHPQDAEDLSQEVWLKAYAAISTFRNESSFYTWLRRITINCFLNHQRARTIEWRGQTTEIRWLELESLQTSGRSMYSSSLESTLENKMLVRKVLQALAEVSPQQRLVFLLKHHEGMTCEEIARALGSSRGTVKKSLFRAVRKIREHLDAKLETGDYLPCAAAEY